MKNIARIAGVSVSTVSKALSDSKEISESTKSKIKQIAKDCGYFTERRDRIKEYKKDTNITIVVLCPEITSPFYSYVATILCNEIEHRGGHGMVMISSFDGKTEDNIIERLTEDKNIDGVVSFRCEEFSNKFQIPCVTVYDSPIYDSVVLNTNKGIRKAVSYLHDLGHIDIGFIGEKLTMQKLLWFKDAMNDENLKTNNDFICISDKRFEEAGSNSAYKFLSNNSLPSAVLAAYDEIALGFINTLKREGFNVPNDISIIGINDSPSSSYSEIPLTTIGGNLKELCEIVINILERKIQDKSYKIIQHIEVESTLIIRGTTGKPDIKY